MYRLATSHPRRIKQLTAVAAACLVLAACASTSSDTSGGTSPSASESTPSSGSDAAAAVTAAMKPLAEADFPKLGPPIKGVDALRGKTVWLITLADRIAISPLVKNSLTAALGSVGIDVRSCDGQANPSVIADCANQAALNKAAAVVFESVDPALTDGLVKKLNGQGIPVVTDNQPSPQGAGNPGDGSWAFVEGPALDAMKLLANWVTVDSGGSGVALVNMVTDSTWSATQVKDGFQPELAKQCPGCKAVINEVQTSNYAKMPAATSSALISNPDVGYVIPQYDSFVDPALQGVESAGRLGQVKGASTTGMLPQLQMIADSHFMAADVATNWAYEGYAVADQVLRLLTGAAPVEHEIPTRLFTAENIGEIDLTPEAAGSGVWFGSTAFTTEFTKLWQGTE